MARLWPDDGFEVYDNCLRQPTIINFSHRWRKADVPAAGRVNKNASRQSLNFFINVCAPVGPSESLQFGHILQHHVCPVINGGYFVGSKTAALTDIIVEPKQGTAELYNGMSNGKRNSVWGSLPLSPFMTTQILDPTHLSISSSSA